MNYGNKHTNKTCHKCNSNKYVNQYQLKCNLINSRKPTKPDLKFFEVLSLINAKKVEHEVSLEVVDF